jgi:hypothetical protein
MTFLSEMDPKTGLLSPTLDRHKGSEMAASYNSAAPFPHVVIDDFLPPAVLTACLESFSEEKNGVAPTFDRAQERLKTQVNPDTLGSFSRQLFYSFNSLPFLRVIANITSIDGLIPDPYFLGGGFHEITQSGHLSVHADFNHHLPMNLERRVNVLIYLNKDWQLDFGGALELWNRDVTECIVRVAPIFNRCVIFNTTSFSYHGNPDPVNHPDGVSRKSIALYYYSATWNGTKRDHTTQFRARADSADKVDWRVKTKEFAEDILPPFVTRAIRGRRAKARNRNA